MHVATIGKGGDGRDRDGVGNVLDGSHHPPLSVGTLLMIPNSPLALSSPLGEDLSPFNIGQNSASSFPSGGFSKPNTKQVNLKRKSLSTALGQSPTRET